MSDPKVSTSAELAKALGVNVSTVNRWRSEGLISAKISRPGFVRYDIPEVITKLADSSYEKDPGMAPTL